MRLAYLIPEETKTCEELAIQIIKELAKQVDALEDELYKANVEISKLKKEIGRKEA